MSLAEAEARREARKAVKAAERDAALAVDLDAISELEDASDAPIKVIRTPLVAGHAAVAVRCPNGAEIKRYRDMIKTRKDGKQGDAVAAHEALGASCSIYPPHDKSGEPGADFVAMCDALPSLLGQCGTEAVALSAGEAEAAGKS